MGAWLTPDVPPEGKFWERRLRIPAHSTFGAIVSGALINLCYPSSFEQSGELTPEETASYFAEMYGYYTANEEEPPFWQDETDVDDETSTGQPWYDSLSDWVIQGFLAISGFPAAAIVYSTSVPKIRIAIRKGDFGALFKVLLDNLELYTGDSYAPLQQIFETQLDLQAFADANELGPGPWELRIVHDGPGPNLPEGDNGQLQIVRKRLIDAMAIEFRQTDPCLLEYSDDGGENWQTAADLSLCSAPTAPTGVIMPFADDTIPSGWLLCNGQAVSRATYGDLFALIGTLYGVGDGSTTFNVPDLRGRAPIGAGQGSGLTDRALAATGGEEVHQLSTAEMPYHSHTPRNGGSVVTLPYGVSGNYNFQATPGSQYEVTSSTGYAGSSSSHNNMEPWLALNFIIKT